jgi:hypothetical protein
MMEATRVLIGKVGSKLVFATDFSEVDHQYGDTRKICFHKPKMELKEGYIVSIKYKREKQIKNLPLMLVGIKEFDVLSRKPDVDFLLDL